MAEKPKPQFGTRIPAVPPPAPPAKRSGHVALLLMGTLAVGGGAYAMMPREGCEPATPGATAPSAAAACPPRGSSSGGSGGSSSRAGYYSNNSSSQSPASASSGSGEVKRGGFGSFAHAFGSHFSVGG